MTSAELASQERFLVALTDLCREHEVALIISQPVVLRIAGKFNGYLENETAGDAWVTQDSGRRLSY